MKTKKISLSEIRNVLNKDELKKVIGGCGPKCPDDCFNDGGTDTCTFIVGCGHCTAYPNNFGMCV